MRQHILPLGGTLADLADYFGNELGRLSSAELSALAHDASQLGMVTMHEYYRSIGGERNLIGYARCLVVQQS